MSLPPQGLHREGTGAPQTLASQLLVPASSIPPLLTIEKLHTYFYTDDGVVKAVNDASFVVRKGQTLGIVGESGCGKSMTALSIMGLVPLPGRIAEGRITLDDDGKPVVLTELPAAQLRRIRGSKIAMIFQEPMTSLNPVLTIGHQIAETILIHENVSRNEARQRTIEMLRRVKIPDPEKRVDQYPHQMSGGMRQRVMIAMALSCNPRLLIADEPTTALDVTIQAQVLDLLRELQADYGMSIIIITHDLGVVAEMADEVAVMYASHVVEYASVGELFQNPLHPYTQGLFRSRPSSGMKIGERLQTIPGIVPRPQDFPPGCKFHPRCRHAQENCTVDLPLLREIVPGHLVSCHYAGNLPPAKD